MDLTLLTERIGDPATAGLLGLLTGVLFGIAAQRSAFCLRAATVEFAEGRAGPRACLWLLSVGAALVLVQAGRLAGVFDPAEARMMAAAGSISGAMLGGAMFGAGMILAHGCPGRLLVLAATGNLRSVLSGLVLVVTAQMAIQGWLGEARRTLAGLWTTPQERNVDLGARLGLPDQGALTLGAGLAVVALILARRHRPGGAATVFGVLVGLAVATGFLATGRLAQVAFDPVSVGSISFIAPSAETLMALLVPFEGWSFEIGLVPGVVAGSFLAAAAARDLRFETFRSPAQTVRALAGAVMMGFGGALAGGCSVGNGVSGVSIMALTAWIALGAMILGGIVTHRLMDADRATGS